MKVLGFALVLAFASPLVVACGATRNAAARDPMRCERDPACGRARGSYPDCSRQCADDPECMDRCREAEVDRLGKP